MTDLTVSEMSGTAALPRRNGELVFTEPWEGRAFGIAVALTESGAYDWEDFRQRLIAEIDSDHAARYYEHWLSSLQQVLLARGLLTEQELELREGELAAADEHEHDEHDHVHHDHAHSTTEVTT